MKELIGKKILEVKLGEKTRRYLTFETEDGVINYYTGYRGRIVNMFGVEALFDAYVMNVKGFWFSIGRMYYCEIETEYGKCSIYTSNSQLVYIDSYITFNDNMKMVISNI